MDKSATRKIFFRACSMMCAVAIVASAAICRASAQTTSEPSFEVATIKPVIRDASHHFDPKHYGPHVGPDGASYYSMTVEFLISYAYGVEGPQVTGPEWTTSEQFDIETRFPEGTGEGSDRKMMQALLKDRFKLSFHVVKRELESYALVVGKGGDKLKPSPSDPAQPDTGGVDTSDKKRFGVQTASFNQETSSMHFEQSKMTMDDLARRLSVCVDTSYHKVVDETGIKGNYQVAYDCPVPTSRHSAGTGALPPDPDGGYALTKSLDALGLRLEKRKKMQDVYVIDHVERPSGN